MYDDRSTWHYPHPVSSHNKDTGPDRPWEGEKKTNGKKWAGISALVVVILITFASCLNMFTDVAKEYAPLEPQTLTQTTESG